MLQIIQLHSMPQVKHNLQKKYFLQSTESTRKSNTDIIQTIDKCLTTKVLYFIASSAVANALEKVLVLK